MPTDSGAALAGPSTPAPRLARLITEVFAPAVWAAALPMVIAVHAAESGRAGLAFGLLAVGFCSAIPYAMVWLGVRSGRLTDHHIGQREQRRTPLLLGLTSVAIGLTLLAVTGAPSQLIAAVAAGFTAGVGVTIANQFWKLSAHAAVSAGSVSVLVMVFGPALLAGAIIVALVGWSRVALGDHTTGQVLVGTVVGATLSAVTFGLLT